MGMYFRDADPTTLLRQLNEFARDVWTRLNGGITGQAIKPESIDIANISQAAITELKAGSVDAAEITALHAQVDNLEATYVDTDSLNAAKARITDLEVGSATLDSLKADTADVDSLLAGKADIGKLNAAIATIDTLITADSAFSESLSSVNANIQNLQSQAAKFVDIDAFNAEIVSLNASDINAARIRGGKLSVELLEIRGSDKSLVFALNNAGTGLNSTSVDTLDGNIITEKTISASHINTTGFTADDGVIKSLYADKLIGGSIKANIAIAAKLTAGDPELAHIDIGVFQNGTTLEPRIEVYNAGSVTPDRSILPTGDKFGSKVFQSLWPSSGTRTGLGVFVG